jgi:Xaa-Pro dipeptidase
MFGATEQTSRRLARSTAARKRVETWLGAPRAPQGLVLTGPAAVAWITGGVAPPVDRTAGVDLIWAVITSKGAGLITTEVEHDRILADYEPAAHGFADLIQVPWWTPEAFVTAAEKLAGSPASALAADGHPAFGSDASVDLISMRLALSDPEQADMRQLGADAAEALQAGLRAWVPGERDLDVQARVSAHLESKGADTPVLIVGGDERLRRFRHPMALGDRMNQIAMAVVVARRGGLHAAATRFASDGPVEGDLASCRARTLKIERDVLSACRPGSTYGRAVAALDASYSAQDARGGWAGHYQGGPIGYAQREFEIAPVQLASPWYGCSIEVGHAVAWNPSLPGGAKVEDTYLITESGLDRITDSPGWPVESGDLMDPPRPAIFDISA